MYGMIHQALREMAMEAIGESEWERLLKTAGFNHTLFIGMEYYSDQASMALMELVADRMGTSLDDFLRAFGRGWIDFAGASAYGRALRMTGDDFVTFLENLDRMHSSIRSNMPRADMPSFELMQAGAQRIVLCYRSSRSGLEPFVEGILTAAAERFGEQVTMTYRRQPDGVHFDIRRGPPHG
ncbi:MAG: heme NO-binding domain-containing protein [Alkalilacustris sp.]